MADKPTVFNYAKYQMAVKQVEELTAKLEVLQEKYDAEHKRGSGEPMGREDFLHEAEKCVCGHRETDYGTPEMSFRTIAMFWETYLTVAGCGVDITLFPDDVAQMMMLLKIARCCTGAGALDNYVDIAGYAACAGEIAAKRMDGNGERT